MYPCSFEKPFTGSSLESRRDAGRRFSQFRRRGRGVAVVDPVVQHPSDVVIRPARLRVTGPRDLADVPALHPNLEMY